MPSARLAELTEAVLDADAVIAVTPIFSASYSGLFKMFFDVLQPEALAGRLVLIAATAGTARHSLALEHAMRPLFAYLRTTVVPTGVFAATEDWAVADGALGARIERAAGELAALLVGANAPTSGRGAGGHPVRRAPRPPLSASRRRTRRLVRRSQSSPSTGSTSGTKP